MSQSDNLMNTQQAASYLGMSASLLAKARVHGTPNIPFVKIGAAVRYRKSDLDEFIESRIHSSTKTTG